MWRWHSIVACSVVLCVVLACLVAPTFDPGRPPTSSPASAASETVVRRGETLQGALIRARIHAADAAEIVAALGAGVNMRRVRPGERVVVVQTEDGNLLRVDYRPSAVEWHEVRPAGEGWTARRVLAPVETRIAAVVGRLENSLFHSMDRLGETPVLTARFVSLFEWDFDFSADSLPNDGFRVLVEKQYVGDELVAYGDILIAQYLPVDRPALTAVAFAEPGGTTSYFDKEGRSVKKAFLRAPLDFTRITSGYSLARVHPVLGGVRPHLAVDYGAPLGTPVRAVADGVVAYAGWRGGNGISITLRHTRGYETMYNHLSRLHVRRGDRVRQRQIIGRVGSTGLSSGPHLDYRVIKNGRFVNPLNEQFLPGLEVPPEHRRAFEETLTSLLERLAREAPLHDASDGSRPIDAAGAGDKSDES